MMVCFAFSELDRFFEKLDSPPILKFGHFKMSKNEEWKKSQKPTNPLFYPPHTAQKTKKVHKQQNTE
jgi:hypothetical protein